MVGAALAYQEEEKPIYWPLGSSWSWERPGTSGVNGGLGG
jgi:hypothetical protein